MACCVKCGYQMADDSSFCPKCGTPFGGGVNNQMMQPGTLSEQERRRALEELPKMIAYFKPMQKKYDKYDSIGERIMKIDDAKKPFPVLMIGIVLLALSPCFFARIHYYLERFTNLPVVKIVNLVKFLMFVPGILFILLFIGILISRKIRKKKLYEKLAAISMELEAHVQGYGYCPVGAEYSNPKILEQIYSLIKSGRANTPSEAINVMIEDAHRTEMEIEAYLTRANAELAASNSGSSGPNAGAVAVAGAFCFASMFF